MTVLDEAPGQVVLEEQLFLAGRDRPAADGATYEVHNPYSGAVLARVPDAAGEDMAEAITAARQSYEQGVWANRHPRDRAAVLARAVAILTAEQEFLAELETANLGAPIRSTTNLLVGGAVLFADELADLAGRDLTESRPLQTSPSLVSQTIRHLPVGVVGAITPWNFPLLSAVFKVFPALAAGNSVVLKPSPLCPLTSLRLARILRDAGLPDGVLSVVTGQAPELGAMLTSHPEVDMVSFTGSCEIGRLVGMACAEHYKRCILELGGKSPVTVLPGSDYDLTVDACLFAVYMNSGQFCEAGSRLLVPAAEYDAFVERLVARASKITLGDPQDYDTDLGPLVSGAQRQRVLGFIAAGQAEGAELLLGGGTPDLPGWFVEPTIFGRVRNDMHIAREEVFGPVLCVIPYADLDEALQIANDTPYGLAAGVFGSDYVEAVDYAQRLRAGSVWINDYHQISPHMPFGGFKRSGIGREMGVEGIRAYTETQSFYVDLARKREQKFYGLVCAAE